MNTDCIRGCNCNKIEASVSNRLPVSLLIGLLIGITLTNGVWADEINIQREIGSVSTGSEKLFDFNINTSVSYELRSTISDAQRYYDNDFFQDLQLGITMPQNNLFEFHFLGSLREDIDGGSDLIYFSPLEDIGDTRTTQIFGYVYESHFDINYLLPSLKQIRIGRQAGERDEPLFFDGLAVDLELFRRIFMTLYGGVAFHYFEIDYSWGSDLLGGVGIDYSPFPSTAINLDYLFVKDDQSTVSETTVYDHLIALKLRQEFFSFIRSRIKLRVINLSFQDLSANIIATFPEIDLELSTSQNIRFISSDEFSNELSSYNALLGSFIPYYSFDGKIRKLFGQNLATDLGFFIRGLVGQQDSSIFNREYSRIYSIAELNDILFAGFFFSVSGDLWLSGDNEYYSAGLDLGYTFQRVLKDTTINFGTYFSLYKYTYNPEPEEKELIRTFYARIRLPFGKNFSLYCNYEFEASLEPYHKLKIETHYEY